MSKFKSTQHHNLAVAADDDDCDVVAPLSFSTSSLCIAYAQLPFNQRVEKQKNNNNADILSSAILVSNILSFHAATRARNDFATHGFCIFCIFNYRIICYDQLDGLALLMSISIFNLICI